MSRAIDRDERDLVEAGFSRPLGLTIPAKSEYVLIARLVVAHVGQAAGFSPEEIYDLKLAITEAATNVIRHAEVDSFDIEYRKQGGTIEVSVIDAGGGFDTRKNAETTPGGIEGGLGLSVIRDLVDDVDIESRPGGTRLRMICHAAGTSVETPSG